MTTSPTQTTSSGPDATRTAETTAPPTIVGRSSRERLHALPETERIHTTAGPQPAQMQAARTSRQTEANAAARSSFPPNGPSVARHAAGHDTPLPGLLAPGAGRPGGHLGHHKDTAGSTCP